MASRPGAFDVILLADTLVYFGALEHAFRTAHVALQPGGILVFALELLPARTGGPAYRLEPHGRYSHSADYVTELLAKTGYTLCAIQQDAFRKEMDADVAGLAVVARRTAG
jgi:predicted TPR repeat methyltransferase